MSRAVLRVRALARKPTHRGFISSKAVAFVDRYYDHRHLLVADLVNESIAKSAQLDFVAADEIRM